MNMVFLFQNKSCQCYKPIAMMHVVYSLWFVKKLVKRNCFVLVFRKSETLLSANILPDWL